jgi:hypothetical protein
MNRPKTKGQIVEHPAIGLFTELFAAAKPALVAADHEWQEVAVKDAPDFRALSLLNPDENGLSDILAELLDPRASHGQGETFLNLFSSRCGSVGKHPKDRVTVHRESCTVFIANQRRRIDLLIDGGMWGIGIENKPWAGEQKDQLQDYADDLEKRFGKNFLLIRLTGQDVDATSMDPARQKQLSAQGKFASWRYAVDLIAWVSECRQHCQAPRVATFLDEFSRYITVEFLTATNPRADMERKYLLPALESILKKDPSQLQSAAAIAEVFPELRQKFVGQLFDEIEEDVLKALKSGWKADRTPGDFVGPDYPKFWFSHDDWNKLYRVQLEWQLTKKRLVFGVWHDPRRNIKKNDEVARELKRLGWGKEGGGAYWDAHSSLPEPFTNWATSSGIVAVVKQRKELKTLLTKEFITLCNHFKDSLAKLAKAAAPQRS